MDGTVQTKEAVVLALDLSTSCTGWALFDADTKELLKWGKLRASTSGLSKMGDLRAKLEKMLRLASEIKALCDCYLPMKIVIEEIAGSKNRLGQKTLDGFHWIVLYTLSYDLDRVIFYDVTGAHGWRTNLSIRLTAADKKNNAEARKLNPKLAKGQKLPIVGNKHLSCRYANETFGMDLDIDRNSTDADVADAVCMGHAFLKFRFAEL